MAYKYAVIWFVNSKFYLSNHPRPRNVECKIKMFISLKRAIKFSKEWTPPALIYRLKQLGDRITMENKKLERSLKKNLQIYGNNCFNDGYNKSIEEFEKMIDIDKIYPIDIFPEVSKDELRLINEYCQEVLKFPLDRLSANISREILKGIKKQLQELKKEVINNDK